MTFPGSSHHSSRPKGCVSRVLLVSPQSGIGSAYDLCFREQAPACVPAAELPLAWRARPRELEAFRYDETANALELAHVGGAVLYRVPCSAEQYSEFLRSEAPGRYVRRRLKAQARRRGQSIEVLPREW
jgi:hypothetical protein